MLESSLEFRGGQTQFRRGRYLEGRRASNPIGMSGTNILLHAALCVTVRYRLDIAVVSFRLNVSE
jgi:hypothetical protein